MRTIDADAAKQHWSGDNVICQTMQRIFEELPTIDPARAAGVCYCRECKYRGEIGCTHAYYDAAGKLQFAAPYMTDQDGCTRGEPKEAQDD